MYRLSERLGSYGPEAQRFFRFVVIGIMATVIDFGTFNLLQATLIPPMGELGRVTLATAIGYGVGLLFNYLLNRYWNYPTARKKAAWVQFMQFVSVYMAALLLRSLVVYLTYPTWLATLDLVLAVDTLTLQRVSTNVAALGGIALTLLWNFFLNRLWTFGEVGRFGADTHSKFVE